MTPQQNIQHYLSNPLVVGHELNGRRVRLLTRVNGDVVHERGVVVQNGVVQPIAADIPDLPNGGTVFMSVDYQYAPIDPFEEFRNCMTIILSVEQEMRQATEINDRMLNDLKGAAERSLFALASLETRAQR